MHVGFCKSYAIFTFRINYDSLIFTMRHMEVYNDHCVIPATAGVSGKNSACKTQPHIVRAYSVHDYYISYQFRDNYTL